MSLSLSFAERGSQRSGSQGFPDLAQGLKTLKKVAGKKIAQKEETQIEGRREQGTVVKQ